MHRVLILGAGLVSRPIVRYFLEQSDCRLTVATMFQSDAESLIGDHPTARATEADVTDRDRLVELVSDADLVVSLVPFHLHAKVAEIAIEHRTHLVTTSYVSPEMKALHQRALDADLLLLNECGLDPGLDHMSAMRVIDQIHRDGGKIVTFESCCGGLPAPDACNNPWNYKFSWSPRGALVAGTYGARYLDRGETVEIEGVDLFQSQRDYPVDGLGDFESYPNRDSLPYIEKYGLEHVRRMLRGTIRYPGWSRAMKGMVDLGYLSLDSRTWPQGATYATLTETLLDDNGEGALAPRVAARLGRSTDDDLIQRMEWAGLFGDEPLNEGEAAPLDLLATLFERKLAYSGNERDMVVMQHRFDVERPDGGRETHHSQLIAYGEPGGETATARTVSWPAAIACRMLLDGKLSLRGVRIPIREELYSPILDALEPMGIAFREWIDREND